MPARALRLHRLLLVLGVALAVGVLAGVGFAVQTARQAPAWLDLARKSKQAGDLPAAERFYEQYLEYRKNDADVRFELAGVLDEHAQASLARPREAFKLWEQSLAEAYKGLQADGRRHDERRKLAKLNLLLGRPTAARTELDVMLKEPELRADPELLDLLASTEPGTPAGKEAAANHLRAAVATGKAAPDVSARLAAVLRQDVGTPRAKQEADEVMAALVKARPDDLAAPPRPRPLPGRLRPPVAGGRGHPPRLRPHPRRAAERGRDPRPRRRGGRRRPRRRPPHPGRRGEGTPGRLAPGHGAGRGGAAGAR